MVPPPWTGADAELVPIAPGEAVPSDAGAAAEELVAGLPEGWPGPEPVVTSGLVPEGVDPPDGAFPPRPPEDGPVAGTRPAPTVPVVEERAAGVAPPGEFEDDVGAAGSPSCFVRRRTSTASRSRPGRSSIRDSPAGGPASLVL
jgi:hypothetical protein